MARGKKTFRPQKKSAVDENYTGALAELPPVFSSIYDHDHVPLWFAQALEQASGEGDDNPDLVTADVLAPAGARWINGDGSDATLAVEEEIRDLWKGIYEGHKAQLKRHLSESLKLLCKHFDVDMRAPDAGWALAIALAKKHVPAFQIARSVREHFSRRSKKPIKLDVEGTCCLVLRGWLDNVRERRPLSPGEEDLVRVFDKEISSRGLKDRTIRDLKRQMLGAHQASLDGTSTEFQRQFVEHAQPLMVRIFEDVRAKSVPGKT